MKKSKTAAFIDPLPIVHPIRAGKLLEPRHKACYVKVKGDEVLNFIELGKTYENAVCVVCGKRLADWAQIPVQQEIRKEQFAQLELWGN